MISGAHVMIFTRDEPLIVRFYAMCSVFPAWTLAAAG